VLFSDGNFIKLPELLYPIQTKMVGRPVLVFLQMCRGSFNEYLSDNVTNDRQKWHTLRDTFIFYASRSKLKKLWISKKLQICRAFLYRFSLKISEKKIYKIAHFHYVTVGQVIRVRLLIFVGLKFCYRYQNKAK